MSFAQLVVTYLSLFSSVVLAAPASATKFGKDSATVPSTCNGFPELCGRKYSNVTFIGTHDSAFVGILPTENQDASVANQLASGVRFLQGQIHNFLSIPQFCHTSCLELDAGTVKSYLQTVKTFLDNNPNEVVTMLWTNPDKISMKTYDGIFKSVGADKYVYKPSANPMQLNDWPTLGDMISSGQRLVTFIDYGADQNSVPYLMDEFNHFWEDPFDQTDSSFTECNVDRQNKAHPDGTNSMYILNHFLDEKIITDSILIPDRGDAANTNSAGKIQTQAQNCGAKWGKYPNVVLVDFEDKGNPMDAAKWMNGL